jgi:hypothetical protein
VAIGVAIVVEKRAERKMRAVVVVFMVVLVAWVPRSLIRREGVYVVSLTISERPALN